jgi:hypothetical protein
MKVAIVLLWACVSAAATDSPFLILSRQEAESIRRNAGQEPAGARQAMQALRRHITRVLQDGPWSVTFNRPPFRGIDPHDYYSEGPYWWPNPANPDGPYIQRDGETNPDRFIANNRDMERMTEAVLVLGMGAYFLRDKQSAERAARILSVWFLDKQTRMNPHLEHAQAIHGITEGRSIGISDTVTLIRGVQGVAFLENSGYWNKRDAVALRRWFLDYLHWLTRSEKGVQEMNEKNNHATWWTAQVATLAVFVGDKTSQEIAWSRYRRHLVPVQMRPDGSCPLEEARTKSLFYSAENLNGFATICRLAERRGVDLWRFQTPEGAGMARSAAYLAPYIAHPETWNKKQIVPFETGMAYFLALAGLGLNIPGYVKLYEDVVPLNGGWNCLLVLEANSLLTP